MPVRLRSSALLLACLALAVLAAACRSESGGTSGFERRERPVEGAARPFRLGFSDVPWTMTEQAYRQTYDMAANYGEVVLVQRAPSWGDFLPGADVSDQQRTQTVALREGARSRGLVVAVALDPFDPAARDRLQRLPSSHTGRGLEQDDLRRAFVAEAVFVARNLRPAYLVIGTDVNSTFERNPQGYRDFVRAYREAYDAVKQAAPETLVFPSFQYEELLGVVPELPPHSPRWELLADFSGKIDMLGITTYPSFAYRLARDVPPDYYSSIRTQTGLPVAFVSASFAAAGSDAASGATPAEQRRYLERLLNEADALRSPLLIWFALRDLSFATEPPYDAVATIGLRDLGDRPKEAWPAWVAASNRPYNPSAERPAATATATPVRR